MAFVQNVNSVERLGYTYPENYTGNYPADAINVNGLLVNGVPFMAQYGKVTHGIEDQQHTVTNFTTTEGVKPRYHCISKISSMYPHVTYGVLFHDLSVLLVNTGDPMVFSQTGKGMKHELTNVTITAPIFPDSESKPFNILEHLKWGTDGSEAALDNIISVELRAVQAVKPIIGDDGYYVHINDWIPIFTGISVGLKNENSTLRTDVHARSKKSLLWKVLKGSDTSRYFEVDSNGATAICQSHTPIKKKGDVIAWNAVFMLENPTITIDDDLTDERY